MQIMNNLPYLQDAFDIKYKNHSFDPRNITSQLFAMDNDIYESRMGVNPSRLGSYYIFEANNVTK